MAHTFIGQMQPGQNIDDIYLVKEPILRSTTRGDYYIAMYLCDKTGQINGRMWQATEATYRSLPKPGFIHVRGRSELYQNNLQVVLNSVRPVSSDQVDLDEFLPRTDKDTDKLFTEVKTCLACIENVEVKAVVDAFLSDVALMDGFKTSPAGIKLHHDYLGGLLEHTHNMLRVAQAVLPFYPEVQADLVLAGIFLHDIGKTTELTCDMAFSYTDSGQLIGHITQAILMVHEKVAALRAAGTPVAEKTVNCLCHIILAHHGQYEFGSPRLPATAEAHMVVEIDNLDSKINQVKTAIKNERSDGAWTSWHNALQTRIYRESLD